MRALRFITILTASITLAPLMAHLLELPNKMKLNREAYLTVQGIYSGWELLGFFEVGTVICSAILLLIAIKKRSRIFLFSCSFLSFAFALALFFLFTFPTNQVTKNWTILPESNWIQLRARWEYSHAVRTLLFIMGLILLLCGKVNDHRIHPKKVYSKNNQSL